MAEKIQTERLAKAKQVPKTQFIIYFFKDFLMQTIFKVFIEFVTTLLEFYISVFWLRGMWDLSSRPEIKPSPPVMEG